MLVSEIHDNLTRQHYLSLSGLSLYSLLGNLIVIAYALDDIIEREHLLIDFHGTLYHSLYESHVDVTVIYHTVSHQRIDDTLQVAHAAIGIFRDVSHHVIWNIETVTLDFSREYVDAELHVWLLQFCHESA